MRIKRFVNQDPVEQHNSLKQFKRWRKERIRKLRLKDYSYKVPNVEPDVLFLQKNRAHPSITWIGHSTFFIQIGGLNIVTDPVWSEQMAFQKRLSPPGIPIADVPQVDIVLISHSHYDHLNISSLRKLKGRKLLLVPAGLRAKLRLKGFKNVKELHWWESIKVSGMKFTFVPSQHWTRRNPWDTNSSHWGGWVIEGAGAYSEEGAIARRETAAASAKPSQREGAYTSPATSSQRAEADPSAATSHEEQAEASMKLPPERAGSDRPLVSAAPTLYFAGDSGYFPGFKDIGKRFDIDVALIPIGAYEPEWFMGPQHVTPEEALQAFEDIGARWFVPMHYGAFKLADDTPREALDRLEAERCRRCLDDNRIVVLPHGETWKLSDRK